MSASLSNNTFTCSANVNDGASSNKLNSTDPDETFNTNPNQDCASSSSSDDDDDGESEGDGDDLNEEESPLSLEEILYSASSFHAIARPVFITMVLASLSAVYVNNESTMEAGAKQFAAAYQVWSLDDSGDSSTGKNLAMSIGNTLVMVTVIAGMTFGIVLLYKYRCMKFLVGYMVMSSASLLGLLGDYMGTIAIGVYRIPIDVITYYSSLYNFAIVGIIAIFYQQGVPSSITQMYLVFTSVILAWHLSHFDEWTAWTLLVMLALYDLCAVLTPCGPLKALVNLMQEDDSPDMPGLLYEAQLPTGTQKPGGNNFGSNANKSGNTQNNSAGQSMAYSPPFTTSENDAGTATATGTATASVPLDSGLEHTDSTAPSRTTRHSRRRRRNGDEKSLNCNGDTKSPPITLQNDDDSDKKPAAVTASTSSSPLTDTIRLSLPLAIAKVYKLKLASNYGTHTSNISQSKKPRRRKNQHIDEDESLVVNPSPLLADWEQSSSSEQFYDRKFSVKELISSVEVEMPRNGGRIVKKDGSASDNDGSRCLKDGESSYAVIGLDGEIKRVLMVNRRGKVYEINDEDEDDEESDDGFEDEGPASIRLGLGDFIFYSVLVAKAALHSFTTFAACILVIMAGLGGTLLMLSVYHSALPALPISIFLGVAFYLLTRLVIEPWIEVVLYAPLYV